MPGYLVVDIRHWIDEDENATAPQLKGKVKFLKDVIAYETSMEAGTELFPSPRCRRKPKRKQCEGHLFTLTEDDPLKPESEQIIWWQCPVCDDRGIVSGWKGLTCDMSDYDDVEIRN